MFRDMHSYSIGLAPRARWRAPSAAAVLLGLALNALTADAQRPERTLTGAFTADCMTLGAQRDAFSPIIRSGPDSLWPWRILGAHYDRRNRTLRSGELVIFDVGCERDHYVSDVGRTFPVDSRFTPRQQELVQLARKYMHTEDEVLITATGSENLTSRLPRDAIGLEALRQGIALTSTRPDTGPRPSPVGAPPSGLLGRFADDYGNDFRISAALFEQLPRGRFHVVEWNVTALYLIAQNDNANPSDAGLWTRIDWMPFEGMAPYVWGFCLTAYRAASEAAARATVSADRAAPRVGCNGFPFSRLKPAP